RGQRPSVPGRALPPEPVGDHRQRHPGDGRGDHLRHRQASGTTEGLGVDDEHAHRLGERERGDRQEHPAQAHRRQPEHHRGGSAEQHADHDRDAQRRQVTHLVRAGSQGHRPERGDRSETGLAETELAGDQHRVEGEREDRADGDEDQGGVAEHHTSRTLRLPNSPCGRTTRIRNRSAKATRSRQLEPMYCTVNTSATPSSRPPTSAPGSEDIPPTMITARPLSSIAEPMPSCAVFTFSANRAPATAPSAEEIANVVAVTRSTFTPSTRAAVGFSAIARIPRPNRVRATRNPSATTSSTEITRIATCTREI